MPLELTNLTVKVNTKAAYYCSKDDMAHTSRSAGCCCTGSAQATGTGNQLTMANPVSAVK